MRPLDRRVSPAASRAHYTVAVNKMASSAAPQARSTVAATQKRPDIIKLAKTLKGVPMCEEYEKMISGMLCVRFYSWAVRRTHSLIATTHLPPYSIKFAIGAEA